MLWGVVAAAREVGGRNSVRADAGDAGCAGTRAAEVARSIVRASVTRPVTRPLTSDVFDCPKVVFVATRAVTIDAANAVRTSGARQSPTREVDKTNTFKASNFILGVCRGIAHVSGAQANSAVGELMPSATRGRYRLEAGIDLRPGSTRELQHVEAIVCAMYAPHRVSRAVVEGSALPRAQGYLHRIDSEIRAINRSAKPRTNICAVSFPLER
jgi:hypothetical protein